MSKKISDKDKKIWENFLNSKKKLFDKDQGSTKKESRHIEKTIDLHGYTLDNANTEIEQSRNTD